MNFTKQKPTVPGWYAWKFPEWKRPRETLAHVVEADHGMVVDFRHDGTTPGGIPDGREWFGPLPEGEAV